MKSTGSFKRGLTKVRREWLAAHYDRALAEVSRLLNEWPDNPRLLIFWADLIQLQDTDEGPSLADAKAAYQRAIELSENSPEALTELGLFIYALEDNAQAALPYFEQAAEVCWSFLEQALVGQAEACAELERWSEAAALLREVHRIQAHRGKSANGDNGEEVLERAKALGRYLQTAAKPPKARRTNSSRSERIE